jgi:hypothetical protein
MKKCFVVTPEGIKSVRCYSVDGDFAITKLHNVPGYGITHLPTGALLVWHDARKLLQPWLGKFGKVQSFDLQTRMKCAKELIAIREDFDANRGPRSDDDDADDIGEAVYYLGEA